MPEFKLPVLLLAVLTLLGISPSIAEESSENQLQHAILVNVNSRKITRSDLDEMGLILFRLSFPDRPLDSITPAEIELLSANALRELIIINLMEDEQLLLNSSGSEQDAINLSSSDVNDHIAALGLERLSHKNYTRRFAASQLIMNIIIGRSGQTFTPSPRYVINFYNKHKHDIFVTKRMVKVRHIFLSSSSLNPETVKKQAGMLYTSLEKMDLQKRLRMFPQVAKEFSQGRFRKDGGLLMGDINEGWFKQDNDFQMPNGNTFFPEAMLKGIRKLSTAGQLTLEKSDSGWHILMLEDIKGGSTIKMNQSRRYIEDFLQQQNMNKAKQFWLRNKIARSTILWNNGEKFDESKIIILDNEEDQWRYLGMRVRQSLQDPRRRR